VSDPFSTAGSEKTARRPRKAFQIGAFAVAAALSLVPVGYGQDTGPTPPAVAESVRVSLVQVPVTVVDKHGRPMKGLTISDFDVREDGKRVRLEAVDAIEYAGLRADSPDGPASGVNTAIAVRKFLLLFDLTFATPSEVKRVLPAASAFVHEQMGPQDAAGIATVSAGGGVKALQQFTHDRSRLAEVLDGETFADHWERERPPSDGVSPGVHSDVRTSLAQDHDRYRRQLASRLITSLEGLSTGLERIPGRKNVLLFSHGFDPQLLTGSTSMPSEPRDLMKSPFGDTDTFGDSGLRTQLDRLHESFRRHDAVIYAVDLGGVGAAADRADQRAGTFGRNRESLAAIARGTGGELLTDSNDFGVLLERVLGETRAAYLLHFVPAETGQPGRFHTLKVKVSRKGASALARTGYYERAPEGARRAPDGQR
jgi:VWFA-related protein